MNKCTSNYRCVNHLTCAMNLSPGRMCLLACLIVSLISSSQSSVIRDDRSTSEEDDYSDYVVVIDAGSSGSRVRVYGLEPRSSLESLPVIRETHNKKEKPGISDFVGRLSDLPAHLMPLIEEARNNIPESEHSTTPLYLMATAGMRMLMEDNANDVMDAINDYLADEDNNPFVYQPLNTRILSGEEEGAFAWLAANYLHGSFEAGTSKSLAGILELGGASTQVAFVPDGAILADKFPVRVAMVDYPVYVHSYLEYGQNVMIDRIEEYLHEANPNLISVFNPCMLNGDAAVKSFDGVDVVFNGTGNPTECRDIIFQFIYKDEFCSPKPCALGQIYQPSISEDQTFFTLGAYYHPLHTIGAIRGDGTYRLADVPALAETYCQKPLSQAQAETGRNDPFLSVECAMALYLHRLFTFSYGIDENNPNLYALNDINDTPIEWTLGAVIYENERRVCGSSPSVGEVKDSAFSPFLSLYLLPFLIISHLAF